MLESSEMEVTYHDGKTGCSARCFRSGLYRHFPSKTRMFHSLIEFIEDSLITRINLIPEDEKYITAPACRPIVSLLLGFGERNPGLTRILTVTDDV